MLNKQLIQSEVQTKIDESKAPKTYVGGVDDPRKYNDNDITEYKELIIRNKLGGYRVFPNITCQFLLNRTFQDGDKNYLVAVTDSIDTAGTMLPIDYYLDKSQQLANTIARALNLVIPALETFDRNQDLQEQLKTVLPDGVYDDGVRANILQKMQEANFEKRLLEVKLQEADGEFQRKDVFEEIMPELLRAEIGYAKIIFPYNITHLHWLSGEIKISKTDHNYNIEVYTHDPYGHGQMAPDSYERIIQAIERRIKNEDRSAVVTCSNETSIYIRRQGVGDGVSCGIITAEDIIKLIQGESLNVETPFEYGALVLREKHIQEVSPYNAAVLERFNRRFEAAKKALSSDNFLFVLSQQQTSISLDLNVNEKDEIIGLIKSIKNQDLREAIINAVSNRELYEAKDGSYIVGVQTSIEQRPALLNSEGVVLDEEDIRSINGIHKLLFSNQGNIKCNADLVYQIGASLVKRNTDYENQLISDLASVHISNNTRTVRGKTITINEMRELVIKYISAAKEYPKTTNNIADIYKELTNENNVTLLYLGYLDQTLLEQLLVYACKLGHLELIRRLVDKEKIDINSKVNVDGNDKIPLEFAIQNSQREVIKYLLAQKAKTTIRDNAQNVIFHALRTAILSKSKDSLEVLLQCGCTRSGIDTILKEKMFQNTEYEDFIKYLKDVLTKREEFIAACTKGNVESVRNFIQQDVYIDSDDFNGRNALFQTVGAGQESVVRVLVDSHATICSSNYSRTSIYKAIEKYQSGNNYFNILKLLLAKEFQVELENDDRKDPGVILARMITTLLYKSKRYDFDFPECVKLRQNIQYFIKFNNWELRDTFQSYEKWVNSLNESYGSYLSSDSDSDEENLYKSAVPEKRKTKVAEIQRKFIDIEGAIYIKPQPKDISELEKTKLLMQSREVEANEVLSRKSLHVNTGKVDKVSPRLDRNRVSPLTKKDKVYYIASYRGYAYITNLWNKDARKVHRKKNELSQPLYSMAVQFEASNTSTFKELHEYEVKLTTQEHKELQKRKDLHAHLIKGKLRMINAVETARLDCSSLSSSTYPGLNMINKFTYDNLSVLLQAVYTTHYGLYFRFLNSELFRNRLTTGHSPFVSTAETPYHALKYAYGIKTFPGHQDEVLKPSWRSDGRSERPYSGKVYIILHPMKDLQDYHRISSLLFAGKLQTPNVIAEERELSHFSFIEQDRIVYQHVAKYPSFNGKYKNIYLYKYGMDPARYSYFRNRFFECQRNGTLDTFTNELAEHLCRYHEIRFAKIAEQEAKKRGGTLIYLDEHGEMKFDGIPATYSTPYGNMGKSSPQQQHKDKITLPERNKRKESKRYRYLINDQVIGSYDKRAEHFAQLIINMKNHGSSLNEELFQYKDKNTLIKSIKTIERQYSSLLHYALIIGNNKLAKALIELIPIIERNKEILVPITHEYINLRDKFGNTPLHLALLNVDEEIYQLLIARGADPAILNNNGLSVLAMKQDKSETTKVPVKIKPATELLVEQKEEKVGRRLDFDQVGISKITGGMETLSLNTNNSGNKSISRSLATIPITILANSDVLQTIELNTGISNTQLIKTSSDNVTITAIRDEEAAKVIQRFWRKKCLQERQPQETEITL